MLTNPTNHHAAWPDGCRQPNTPLATAGGVRHRRKFPLAVGGGGPWSPRAQGALVRGLEVLGAWLFRRITALRLLFGECGGVFILPCFAGRPRAAAMLARGKVLNGRGRPSW